MTIRTPWSTGFRLLVAVALFLLTGGAALAYQDDIKDAVQDEEEASETPGLVDEGEYVSPQFEVGITWTDAWEVGSASDPNVAHAIGGNYDGPVASDPDLGDIVFLVDTESESAVLSLGFSPNEAPVEPDVLLQSMGQETFLEDNLFLSSEAEVLLLEANRTTAAILAREAAPNDDHLVYLSIVADPGTEDYSFWVGLDMYEPDEYEAILTSMVEDIEVEDNDIFDVFGPEEILEAVEASDAAPTEEPAGTEEATEEPVETEEATEEPVETGEARDEVVIPPFDATEKPVETAVATREGDLQLDPTEAATEEPVETEDPLRPLDPTTEPAETEEPAETAEPVEPLEPTETPDATPESGASPVASPAASPQASPAAAPDAPGLVGEGDYRSPQHEVAVEWTEAWTLDPASAPPVQSYPETGVDALYLTDAATERAIVYITIENSGAFDPETTLDALSGADYIESYLGLSAETEVLLSETDPDALAVMYLDASGGEPVAVVLEAQVVDDDTIAFVELRANASDIDAGLLDSVADDIAVNDEPGLGVLTTQQILDALP